MAEADLERVVLPALLALLILGAFVIFATNGGGEDGAVQSAPAARTTPVKGSSSGKPVAIAQRFIKVQAGDTPTSIATKAGLSVERLLDLNPSLDPSSLRPGQTLKLAP